MKRTILLALSAAVVVAWAAPMLKRGSLASLENNFRDSLVTAQMEILAGPRGVYLEGYGAVFVTDINLVYTPSINPFRLKIEEPTITDIHVRKMARVPILRENMRRLLVQSGSALESVPLDEQVVLVVTFLNEQWEVTSGLPTQITMQARRSNLVQAKLGKMNVENIIRVKEL